MNSTAANLIEEILRQQDFQKEAEESKPMDCLDMVETRAYFYRLSHSNFGLEIHMIGYKNVAHIHCEPISAIGLTVFLRSTNGARTFGSFTFIQQDQKEKESLRQIITDNLRVPVDKLKNAENPASKCFGTTSIRNKILEYCQPKDVAKLERVSTFFYYTLLEPLVDTHFWRRHYIQEYGEPENDGTPSTFRNKYAVKKFAMNDWIRFVTSSPLNGFNVFQPIQPPQPVPQIPMIPRRPNPLRPNPEPDHPIQPLYPYPGNYPRRPMPPMIGDFDTPNWHPGAQPLGDPEHILPHFQPRQPRNNPNIPDFGSRNPFGFGGGRGGGPGFGGGGGIV